MLRWIIGNTREDKIQKSKWGNSFKDRGNHYWRKEDGVNWDGLVSFGWEWLMHQWESEILQVEGTKKVEENQK